MTEEKYLEKLVGSYEEIIKLQKDKISLLEEELERLKTTPVSSSSEIPKVKEVQSPTITANVPANPIIKPPFGSMSNTIKRETLQDYIARGGITEIAKEAPVKKPSIPVATATVKIEKEKRPRAWKRFIYFKSKQDALNFVERYSNDFEIGKTKRTYRHASETKFELGKNTTNNDLFAKGYMFVLQFSMNGVDFKAIEELEHLENYGQKKGSRDGGLKSVRLYKGEKEKV